MRIDDEDAIRNRTEMNETAKLKLVPGSQGMNVPSACTIIIIAGKQPQLKLPQ